MGRGDPRAPQGHVRADALGGRVLARSSTRRSGRSTRASINTSSTSGLFANPGQSNYGAAKSGIATLSIIAAKELGRYGVTVNAIAPGARTRMTENLGGAIAPRPSPGEWDARAPENIAPLVDVARERGVRGDHRAGVPRGWRSHRGREAWGRGPGVDQGARWDPAELSGVVPDLVRQLES